MKTYEIGVFPGDGIGPEVVGQAVRVLEALQAQQGDFAMHSCGLKRRCRQTSNLCCAGVRRHRTPPCRTSAQGFVKQVNSGCGNTSV